MSKQQASPNRAVIVASVVLVLAAGALATSLYYFDGVALISDFISGQFAQVSRGPETPSAVTTPDPQAVSSTELELPEGMSEAFALRLWQEQVDSQKMIGYLVKGRMTNLLITAVNTEGDDSFLDVRASLSDGASVDGRIGLKRFDGAWYVVSVTGDRNAKPMQTKLPTIDEVDITLLNTVVAEQFKSKAAIQEYVDGRIKSIQMSKPEPGANTVRIPITMDEDHKVALGDIVVVSYEDDGTNLWFVTRFTKTGSKPLGQ